jgi:hypothetical protein
MSEEDRGNAEKYKDKYLELKFEGVNKSLDRIIKTQEEEKIDRSELWDRLEAVELVQAKCPIGFLAVDVKTLQEDLTVIRFLSKYPKISGVLLIGAAVITLFSLAERIIPLLTK